jgi:hypothetical protein
MAGRNTPEQKNRFLLAQARAMAGQRAKRDRSRPTRPDVKSQVQVAAEESAAQAAAAVDPTVAPPAGDVFDPGDHTVADVVAHVDKHPDELPAILKAEKAGKGRAGVLTLGD